MAGLSKSRILANRQCSKRLWLQINRPELIDVDDAVEGRMATGTYVGEIARDLHLGGVLIDHDDLGQCLLDTAQALKSTSCPIFEATLQYDGVLIRADLLLPEDGGYRLAEVKSSTCVKHYHYADAAVQTWVARNAGVAITRVEIGHIDNSFVYPGGGDYRGLLAYTDITTTIAEMENEVRNWVDAARNTLDGIEPEILPGDHCYDPFSCPFLTHCSPPAEDEEEEYPPEILPYGKNLVMSLRAEGFDDLRKVPEDRLKKAQHQRIWRATISGMAEVDPEAGQQLASLLYPRYYLDFETIGFAVPIWAGTRPYAQIPFQWSCHIETSPGVYQHHAFLADGKTDPHRDFVESLLKVLNKTIASNPILVYNKGFECGRMRELSIAFPDLAPVLHAAIDRVVDLLPITRAHYYHPDMRGSWSIKAVLPTIAPDLAYDRLTVSDGSMAQEAFREIMLNETTEDRRMQLRQALLEYCALDTWAMVRIVRFFVEHHGN